MNNSNILFIIATCLLNLLPLDAAAFEIYYFNHPICSKAEYKGDVLEVATERLYNSNQANNHLKDFLKEVKKNVLRKFQADIICGGKLDSSFHRYKKYSKTYEYLTMSFTGTAMKKIAN